MESSKSQLSLPSELKTELRLYFSDDIIKSALNLVQISQVSISFEKEQPGRYAIVAGIVNDDQAYQSRMTYRLSPTNQVSSQCDCVHWSSEEHCTHVAVLFLKYNFKKYDQMSAEATFGRYRVDLQGIQSRNKGQSVHVTQYGTIIESASKLQNAPPQGHYQGLRYLLTDKKIANFPIPKTFVGALKLIVFPRSSLNINEERSEGEFIPGSESFLRFHYISPKGNEVQEISTFEGLYLFDWNSGDAFDLPDSLQEFITKIRQNYLWYNVNDYLRIGHQLLDQKLLVIEYDGTILNDCPTIEPRCKIVIEKHQKKNFQRVKLLFVDEQDHILPIPPTLRLFLFQHGALTTFTKKVEAYDFLKDTIKSIEDNCNYQRRPRNSSQRTLIQEYLDHFLAKYPQTTYHPELKVLCRFQGDYLFELIKILGQCFTTAFFRSSSYLEHDQVATFEPPSPLLFHNMAAFYDRVKTLGVQIYYHAQKVQFWNSRISFKRVMSAENWFEINLSMNDLDLSVVSNMSDGQTFSLSHQGLVLLTPEQQEMAKFLKKYAQQKQFLGKENELSRYHLVFARGQIFELFELYKMGLSEALAPEEVALCERLLNLESMPEYPLPANIRATPRHYQVLGYHWLRFLYEHRLGACLADDMGLGKTLQTIMFLQSIIKRVKKILIICPVSIILNWRNEIEKFSDLSTTIYYGGSRDIPEDAQIILTSYGVMRREAASSLLTHYFDILIFDEVQHMKNVKSLGSISAKKIRAGYRICLTGTPVENDISEFHNILDLTLPGIWGGSVQSLKDNRMATKRMAKPFILRRTKKEVLSELPEKLDHHIFLTFSPEERKHYVSQLFAIRQQLDSIFASKRYGEVLKSILILRKLCLWQKQEAEISSTKIEFLMENLQQILQEGHQVIVFSQFTTYLDIIQKQVEEQNWSYSRIDGQQTIVRRQKEVEKFQAGATSLFLISLKAGGVGLNLTAASYIFLMDPWWNPAVENQAIDRAHRIGQKNKLTVYRPIIKDSIEEKVLTLQDYKRKLFEDLMGSDEESFYSGQLTMEDFKFLLS